jgi:hypothetical protein
MKKTKQNLLAYAAGIIDGEGSITLLHSFPKRRSLHENWHLRIDVKMNNGKPLELLKGLFGGNISVGRGLKQGNFPSFSWEIGSIRAKRCLKALIPFLRVKKAQAELGIRYQDRLTNAEHHGKGNPLSDHEIEVRRYLANAMHQLNFHSIHIPCAGLETEQVERARALMRQSLLVKKFTNNKV